MTVTIARNSKVLAGSPVLMLREIAKKCNSGLPLAPPHAKWLGEVIHAFLKREAASLEEIMGLRFGRGGLPWRRAEAIRERDEALRELAAAFFSGTGPCVTAREIATLAVRYGASAWQIDRNRDAMPQRYAGKPQAYLWRAFSSGATMPLGERQIRNIVGQPAALPAASGASSQRRLVPC